MLCSNLFYLGTDNVCYPKNTIICSKGALELPSFECVETCRSGTEPVYDIMNEGKYCESIYTYDNK